MKIEDKELLLKDLCARQPYGVMITDGGKTRMLEYLVMVDVAAEKGYKPYLRSMSSMTEEERKEYKHLIAFSGSPNGAANLVDWLNKKMFAYRTIDGKDMFELDLALKAPEGMYNIK